MCFLFSMLVFFFYRYGDHRDLHVLTHSFPTRRSSDLEQLGRQHGADIAGTAGDEDATKVRLLCHGSCCDRWAILAHTLAEAVDFIYRSEEHTSELQSLMRISYAVFCLKKKKQTREENNMNNRQISTRNKTYKIL